MVDYLIKLARIFLILFAVVATANVVSAQTSDSALVRLRLDVDSATVKVDQSLTTQDSFGNQLSKGNWFILKLAVGEHLIEVDAFAQGKKDSSFVLVADQILTLDFIFIVSQEIVPESGNVFFYADPATAEIRVDKTSIGSGSPLISSLIPGQHYVEAVLDGYETLSEQIEIDDAAQISVKLSLKASRPFPLGPVDIDMELMSLRPLRDTSEAQQIRDKFNGLSESFMVVPFAQGVLARIAAGKDQRKEANVLVVAGLTLTAGSYLLGKIFASRRKRQIIEYNAAMEIENFEAKEHNAEVKKILQRANGDRVKTWRTENESRGFIVVEPKQ